MVHEGHHLDLGAHAALEGEEQALENIPWACMAVIDVYTSGEISHVFVTGNVLLFLYNRWNLDIEHDFSKLISLETRI